ncbi:MAG: hypothetical protein ABWY81_10915 [Jiangellaceae bacterium]
MSSWLIFIGYVAVWLTYGWRLSVHLLDDDIRRACPFPYTVEEARSEYLALDLFGGFGLALFWPLVMPVRGVYRIISMGGLFRTPVEVELAQREELEALRSLAREHGLPMPETKP